MAQPLPAHGTRSVSGVGPARAALGWLVHPVTITATALLILNDHLLKSTYPGVLTGKLSDVAGLVMAPPLVALALAVLLPRVRTPYHAAAAICLVSVGFVALKASPTVAGWASKAWSVVNGPSVVLADRTDLLATPALALAWLAWRRARNRPAPTGLPRLVAILVVLPITGLAIAATSAPYYPDAVTAEQWHGMVVVGIGNAYHKGDRAAGYYLASSDGGATFQDLSGADARAGAAAAPARTSGCSSNAPLHCFRVVTGHLRVEETEDGGANWRVAWQVSDGQRARLSSAYPDLGDVSEYLASRSLVVQDQPGGGLTVLVANGRDGFARRDATGHWARIGFGIQVRPSYAITETPVPIPPATPRTVLASLPTPIAVALIAAATAVFLCCAAATLRGRRRWPAAVGLGPLCLGALLVLAAAGSSSHNPLGSPNPLIVFVWVAGVGLLLVGVLTTVSAVLAVRTLATRGVWLAVLIALATGVGVLVPFVALNTWGWPTHTAAIWLAAAAVVVGGGLASIGLGVRYSRTPAPVTGGASPPPPWSAPRPDAPAKATGWTPPPQGRAAPPRDAAPRIRPATPGKGMTADQPHEPPSTPTA